ncbi:alpha/beta hydrolase [Caenibius sp. WL]|uniref:RBBP9/YdeN family alpha/beta hydrolase n=1 Tax=Caenibius sp. WL TaxID=2872646 RepID=UPI001C9A025F|nr:alpha/beta hydrolase [Caenibius sp. WL]QZP06699.1 alpha/beta hydrolase [Caenibius sp. WL]
MTDRTAVSQEIAPEPRILIVPGHDADDAQHWQRAWAATRPHCERLDLGLWDNPHRNTWVNKLNLAINRQDRPVVLVAYGLGCLTVAWWAEYERPAINDPVVGALFVAPPDIDRPGIDPRVAKFGAVPRRELPFPAFLVPCVEDRLCNYRTAYSLAQDWGANFIDPEDNEQETGHPHDKRWPLGEVLLNRLLRNHARPRPLPAGAHARGAVHGGLAEGTAPMRSRSTPL